MNKAGIQERLEMLPSLYATDGMKQREVQIVIFHMFSRWTWYVVEGEKQEDGDWLLFCYCRSGFDYDVCYKREDGEFVDFDPEDEE